MKQNPAEREIRDNMMPGVQSRDGFLGDDTRNIADIVAQDTAVLEEAGVSQEELATLLEDLHRRADAGLGTKVSTCNDRVSVELVSEGMGRIVCPFKCGERAHKAVVEVSTPDTTIRFTPLHAHLIREHGFFEGRGAHFRIEPEALIRLYRTCQEIED